MTLEAGNVIAKRWAGFFALTATVGLLYYYAFKVAMSENPLVAVLIGAAALFLLYGLYLERGAVTVAWQGPLFPTKDLYLFLTVFVGGVVSYWLNVSMGLGAVVASALVGVLAAALLPAYAVPLYCGGFVGMASPKVLGSAGLVLAAAVAGAIYVLAQDVFNGFGGKLGTIACAGCILSASCCGNALLTGSVPSGDVAARIIITSVIAAVTSYLVNVRMEKARLWGQLLWD